MQRLNRYYRCSRIAEAKFRLLVRHFALDLPASDASRLTGISHRSVITIFGKIRRRIAEECERQSPFKNGEVEVDEPYFGPHRVRGKRGRGVGIRGRVSANAVIHSDGRRGYDGLIDLGYSKHYRVNHSADEFANDKSHVNGIESFGSFAKLRLRKFNGVPAATFCLHLKECEWRFNHRHDDLYLELRQYPL